MNTNVPAARHAQDPELKSGILKRAAQVFITTFIQAAILFLAAGQLAWSWAWVWLAIYTVGVAVTAVFMFTYSPQTIAERGKAAGAKDWDKRIGGAWALAHFLFTPLVAGFDHRNGWSGGQSPAFHLAGALAFSLGFSLFSWAMVSNTFFTAVVRLQPERGQRVCRHGPYRYLRHPGYLGAIVMSLGLAILLGSLWALIPAGLAVALMVLRTVYEDRTLRVELPGYEEYAQEVRFRLLPGVW